MPYQRPFTVLLFVIGLICFCPISQGNAADKHHFTTKTNKQTSVNQNEWTQRTPPPHEFNITPSKTQKTVRAKKKNNQNTLPLSHTISETKTVSTHSIADHRLIKPLSPALNFHTQQPNNSPSKSYSLGTASLAFNYERQNDRSQEKTRDFLSGKKTFGFDQNRYIESPLDRDVFHVGMDYAIGKGNINAAIDYTRMKNDKKGNNNINDDADMKSLTFGYTHNMSENTSVYGSITHTEYDLDKNMGNTNNTDEENRINQINIGIKHRF